jgi:hypothetical protein
MKKVDLYIKHIDFVMKDTIARKEERKNMWWLPVVGLLFIACVILGFCFGR